MNAETQFWLLFTNQWVDKKYHLTELLGNGGFGGVYKADEVVGDKLIRKVAVKLIKYDPNLLNSNEELFTVNLKHQNLIDCIVPGECLITIAGKEFRFYYLIMELANGRLGGMVTEVTQLTNIMQNMAAGLAFLHGQEVPIVHRDLKPANILQAGNIWKISDFGLLRRVKRDFTETIHFSGTIPYVPPELFKKGIISPAWDIWSLGVIIVELWTGEHPFKFRDLASLNELQMITEYSNRVQTMEPVINKSLPKPFDQIIERCLQKDFEKRLTAKQILEILNPQPSVSVSVPIPSPPTEGSIPNTIQKKQPKIEIIQFSTSTIRRQKVVNKILFWSFEDVVFVTETKQASCEIATFELGKGVILEMVKIPAGEFMMGAKEGEEGASSDEYPQHKVRIAKPFYMGKYPITQAQYEAIMGENPSYFKGEKRPVEKVSWDMAQEFCKKLSEKTGKEYSLPSEAKWEYAGRGGKTTPFCYGETLTTDLANYNGNYSYGEGPKGVYRQETTEVGIFPPNGFGLYDIHGNVWEWCEDSWHNNYEGAPNDGSAWVTEDKNYSRRRLRGGSWSNNPCYCRVANRNNNVRAYVSNRIGFRVSCAVL